MNLDATIADMLPTAETRGGCSLQRLVRHRSSKLEKSLLEIERRFAIEKGDLVPGRSRWVKTKTREGFVANALTFIPKEDA